MASIIENLAISRIVIHEIYKRTVSDNPSKPSYAMELLKMNSQGKQALQTRLIEALGNNTHCIEMEIVDLSKDGMLEHAKKLIDCSDAQFVERSKYMAEKLSEAQVSMQIPGGIVVVITGTVGVQDNAYVAIIKAEVHSGFHKKLVKASLTAEFLSDLFLTPQQKFYKIGLLIFHKKASSAFVYDHNMTRSETKQAAKYFYESFLGCKVASSSKAITQNFFILTRDFINELEVDTAQKLDYQDDLYSYLRNKNTGTISVGEFCDSYLAIEHRDLYKKCMETAEFPSTAIVKELDLIKNKLKRRKISFSSGVILQRSAGSLKDVLTIERTSEQSTTITIKGKIQDQIT